MRHAGLALVCLCFTAPAWADLACEFDRECLEGEGCLETAFELSVIGETGLRGDDPTEPATRFESVAFDIDGVRRANGEGWRGFVGRDAGGLYALTVAKDGGARLVVQYPSDDLSILYAGRCTPP